MVPHRSPDWVCPTCNVANKDVVLPVGSTDNKAAPPSAADAEAIAQIAFKGAAPPGAAAENGGAKDVCTAIVALTQRDIQCMTLSRHRQF